MDVLKEVNMRHVLWLLYDINYKRLNFVECFVIILTPKIVPSRKNVTLESYNSAAILYITSETTLGENIVNLLVSTISDKTRK